MWYLYYLGKLEYSQFRIIHFCKSRRNKLFMNYFFGSLCPICGNKVPNPFLYLTLSKKTGFEIMCAGIPGIGGDLQYVKHNKILELP